MYPFVLSLAVLTGSLDSIVVATAKHVGVVGLIGAAASSAVSSFVRESWWVGSAASPWAWIRGTASSSSSADTVVPAKIVFQAWVKGIISEVLGEDVQHKVRFNSARSDTTVIVLVP